MIQKKIQQYKEGRNNNMSKISIEHGACPLTRATVIRTYRGKDTVMKDVRTGDESKDLVVYYNATNSRYGDHVGFSDITVMKGEEGHDECNYVSVRGYVIPHGHQNTGFKDGNHTLLDWLGETYRAAFVGYAEHPETYYSHFWGTTSYTGEKKTEYFKDIDIETELRVYKDGKINLVLKFTDALGNETYRMLNPEACKNGLRDALYSLYNYEGMNRDCTAAKYGYIRNDVTSKESQKWLDKVFIRKKDSGSEYNIFLRCTTDLDVYLGRFELATETDLTYSVIDRGTETVDNLRKDQLHIYPMLPTYHNDTAIFHDSLVIDEVNAFFGFGTPDENPTALLIANKCRSDIKKINRSAHDYEVEKPITNTSILLAYCKKIKTTEGKTEALKKNEEIMDVFTKPEGICWERIGDQYIALTCGNKLGIVYDIKKKTKQIMISRAPKGVATWEKKVASLYAIHESVDQVGMKYYGSHLKNIFDSRWNYMSHGAGYYTEQVREDWVKNNLDNIDNYDVAQYMKDGKPAAFDEVFTGTIVQWAYENLPDDYKMFQNKMICYRKDLNSGLFPVLQMDILMMGGNKFAEQTLKSKLYNLFFYNIEDRIHSSRGFEIAGGKNSRDDIKFYYNEKASNLKKMTGMTMDQLRFIDSQIQSYGLIAKFVDGERPRTYMESISSKEELDSLCKRKGYVLVDTALDLLTDEQKSKFTEPELDYLSKMKPDNNTIHIRDICKLGKTYLELPHEEADTNCVKVYDWNSVDMATFRNIYLYGRSLYAGTYRTISEEYGDVVNMFKGLSVKQMFEQLDKYRNLGDYVTERFFTHYKDYLRMRKVYLDCLTATGVSPENIARIGMETFPEKVNPKRIFVHYVSGMRVDEITDSRNMGDHSYMFFSDSKREDINLDTKYGQTHEHAGDLPVDSYAKFMECIYMKFGRFNHRGPMSHAEKEKFVHDYEDGSDTSFANTTYYRGMRHTMLAMKSTGWTSSDTGGLGNDINSLTDSMCDENEKYDNMRITEVWDEFGDFQGVYVDLGYMSRVYWLHDKLTYLISREKIKFDEVMFKDAIGRVADLEWKDEETEMEIIAPTCPEDVVAEGDVLSHCVGSYVQPIISGTENIMFLRRREYPADPFFTVEILPDGEIRQVHCYGNGNPNLPSIKDAYKRCGMRVYDTSEMTEKETDTKMNVLLFLRKWATAMGSKRLKIGSIKPEYGRYCAKH